MSLFKTSRLLISTLDVVEDENHGDAPTEEDEANDNLYPVEVLAAVLSHFEANVRDFTDFTPRKGAWEGVRSGYAQRTDYTHLKKVVIKKK